MSKIGKINNIVKRVLQDNTLYTNDYKLSVSFISKREFDKLQELIQSIITKEERKDKINRILNFEMLIELKVLIDEYVEQLNYTPNQEYYD
jgi:hypothetical protein